MKASTAEKAISYPCDMDDIVLSDNMKYANINLFFFTFVTPPYFMFRDALNYTLHLIFNVWVRQIQHPGIKIVQNAVEVFPEGKPYVQISAFICLVIFVCRD